METIRPNSTRIDSCLAYFGAAAEPSSHTASDLVDGLGGVAIAIGVEAWQILAQTHLETEGRELHVGQFQQGFAASVAVGLNQRLQ